ncbi:MAG TPA: uracil-DNA glycosylase family protein [Spirochaetota bacterium]|nr:uracil-DNA glycosylase family protein [Spirochaetota bacterium]
MYHLLKEAIVTHIQYGRRTPLVLAYTDEISYFFNRKNVAAPVELNTFQEKVQHAVAQCNKCKTTEKNIIHGGDASSGIMIILNPPSMLSSVEKKVLKPDVDTMLDKMMKAIGVHVKTCYITHMIKCESQRELPGTMFSHCQNLLAKEIELVKPQIIIVMGEMRPLQKIVKNSSGIQWFNIEHPITLLKNPELKKPAWNTLKLVKTVLDGK